MLTIPVNYQIYLFKIPQDMRKSFDGLLGLVQTDSSLKPFSGCYFVFLNKRKDKMKVLFWEKGGFCLFFKRLEQGVFKLPDKGLDVPVLEVDSLILQMIIEGVEITNLKRHKRYNIS